jgi:hypothetical protein
MTNTAIPMDLIASPVARDVDVRARGTASITRRVISDALCMLALIILSASLPMLDRATKDLTPLLSSGSRQSL